MVKSAYIHIPFCKSKCHYCSFVSFPKLKLKKDYLKALEKQINFEYKGEVLNTLYFGGGTPSLLEVDEFENLIKHFSLCCDTEITAELNPETLNYDYLRGLLDIGINRLSLGAQTFDDYILRLINRRHNAQQITNSVKTAQNAGFENISLDFIYGLPNQTSQMFFDDLKKAVALGVKHISLYGLTIEEGCYFYDNPAQNIADEDCQADMYLGAVELLKNLGFEHYEFSNFSLAGFYSKHNLNYWDNEYYYGFGVSAHGYKNNIRYSNTNSLEDYIQNPLEYEIERFETPQDKLEEEIFLGFRKMSGIDVLKINRKYNIDFEEKYSKILKKYKGFGLIIKTPQGYALSTKGVLVSNTILSEFLN